MGSRPGRRRRRQSWRKGHAASDNYTGKTAFIGDRTTPGHVYYPGRPFFFFFCNRSRDHCRDLVFLSVSPPSFIPSFHSMARAPSHSHSLSLSHYISFRPVGGPRAAHNRAAVPARIAPPPPFGYNRNKIQLCTPPLSITSSRSFRFYFSRRLRPAPGFRLLIFYFLYVHILTRTQTGAVFFALSVAEIVLVDHVSHIPAVPPLDRTTPFQPDRARARVISFGFPTACGYLYYACRSSDPYLSPTTAVRNCTRYCIAGTHVYRKPRGVSIKRRLLLPRRRPPAQKPIRTDHNYGCTTCASRAARNVFYGALNPTPAFGVVFYPPCRRGRWPLGLLRQSSDRKVSIPAEGKQYHAFLYPVKPFFVDCGGIMNERTEDFLRNRF